MTTFINKERLLECIREALAHMRKYANVDYSRIGGLCEALSIVEDASARDSIEITRCECCVYNSHEAYCADGRTVCRHPHGKYPGSYLLVRPDDFCSYGKKE